MKKEHHYIILVVTFVIGGAIGYWIGQSGITCEGSSAQ